MMLECPECGKATVVVEFSDQVFDYSYGEHAVQIYGNLPTYVCGACGFKYLDKSCQDARDRLAKCQLNSDLRIKRGSL